MSGRIRRKKIKETLKTIKRFRSEYGTRVSYTVARRFVRKLRERKIVIPVRPSSLGSYFENVFNKSRKARRNFDLPVKDERLHAFGYFKELPIRRKGWLASLWGKK
jgi:hypothetical protein